MNYYPFHLGDYAAHTAHLEPMEDLAYRRMLDLYYRTEKPLPLDTAEIARLTAELGYSANPEQIATRLARRDVLRGALGVAALAGIAPLALDRAQAQAGSSTRLTGRG